MCDFEDEEDLDLDPEYWHGFTEFYLQNHTDGETPEDFDQRMTDQYEYYEEWTNRDDELLSMGLDEYDESKRVENYGYTEEDMPDDEAMDGDNGW